MNRSERKEYSKKYYKENKEKFIENGKKYREKNSEKTKEKAKIWRIKNPEKVKENWLKRKYGITLKDYYLLLEKQNYKCAICGSDNPKRDKFFCVDHDHKTGEVRGLLCFICNTSLGGFGDNIRTLEAAINYLK